MKGTRFEASRTPLVFQCLVGPNIYFYISYRYIMTVVTVVVCIHHVRLNPGFICGSPDVSGPKVIIVTQVVRATIAPKDTGKTVKQQRR